jgi:hypothetical protein
MEFVGTRLSNRCPRLTVDRLLGVNGSAFPPAAMRQRAGEQLTDAQALAVPKRGRRAGLDLLTHHRAFARVVTLVAVQSWTKATRRSTSVFPNRISLPPWRVGTPPPSHCVAIVRPGLDWLGSASGSSSKKTWHNPPRGSSSFVTS